jgi:DNA adenine methylase
MTGLLSDVRSLNHLGGHAVAEPFAGGAGAALSLLYREETHEIYINDADPAIHDFWWAVINKSSDFLEMLRSVSVDMAEWRHQRDAYKCSRTSRLKRGFAAFYLNRCNRSGIIINGGPIGGGHQTGKWKLDARFNRDELITRCERVATYGLRIHVSKKDAIDFISGSDHESTFFFIDPPYYHKSETLYLNQLDHAYHERLAEKLRSMDDAAWVLTYDDCPEIRGMYTDWASIHAFSMRYAAAERRRGREILITPKWMQLPKTQTSTAIVW